MGGRRGQDGGRVDRHPLSGARARRQAPGPPGPDAAPPARVAEAWREGAIGADQARAIASARRHRTEAAMARDEEMLVAQAAEMGFEDFTGP